MTRLPPSDALIADTGCRSSIAPSTMAGTGSTSPNRNWRTNGQADCRRASRPAGQNGRFHPPLAAQYRELKTSRRRSQRLLYPVCDTMRVCGGHKPIPPTRFPLRSAPSRPVLHWHARIRTQLNLMGVGSRRSAGPQASMGPSATAGRCLCNRGRCCRRLLIIAYLIV